MCRYIVYLLSLRNLEAKVAERGVYVDHSMMRVADCLDHLSSSRSRDFSIFRARSVLCLEVLDRRYRTIARMHYGRPLLRCTWHILSSTCLQAGGCGDRDAGVGGRVESDSIKVSVIERVVWST